MSSYLEVHLHTPDASPLACVLGSEPGITPFKSHPGNQPQPLLVVTLYLSQREREREGERESAEREREGGRVSACC